MENRLRAFSEDKFIGERKIAYVAEHEGRIVGLMFGTLDSDYEYFKGHLYKMGKREKCGSNGDRRIEREYESP